MMTAKEEQDLRSLAADLAAAEQSAWQPLCIARAFATPVEGALRFTMQAWIDLEAARSPLLEGALPETAAEIDAAVNAFRCGPLDLSPGEAVGLTLLMREAIEEAWTMAMPMTPDSAEGIGLRGSGGFGDWLCILAALIAQLGLSRTEALDTLVAHAFALLPADKANRGWHPTRETYAQRDVLRPVAAEEAEALKEDAHE